MKQSQNFVLCKNNDAQISAFAFVIAFVFFTAFAFSFFFEKMLLVILWFQNFLFPIKLLTKKNIDIKSRKFRDTFWRPAISQVFL